MQMHVDGSGAHEEDKLKQGMIDHVQHCTLGSKAAFLAQEALAGNADENKSDLAHGRACQRALEINREQTEQGTEEHGDAAEKQNHQAPHGIVAEYRERDGQDAEDAGLGQDAGEQSRGRCRGNRVCLGQPDMHREHAALGAKAKEDQCTGKVQTPAGVECFRCL